ncbi:MAG TPA: type III pantothenate kinase, partial [Candidatus Tumulicola sp.]
LTIDAGNSEIKLGVFDPVGTLTSTWRVSTDVRRTPDEYVALFRQLFADADADPQAIAAAAIASVVPKLDAVLDEACRTAFGVTPAFLHAHTQTVIPIATEHPAQSGSDLIAAAIGGRARFGAPLIVVCYGTATVFVAVTNDGAYAGVAIAPGIAISIDALVSRTAKLPQVALDSPEAAIGRNTEDALRSGIVYGFAGQTDAIVSRIREELGGEAHVVATGGMAQTFARHTTTVREVDPHLSLRGLQLFHASLED